MAWVRFRSPLGKSPTTLLLSEEALDSSSKTLSYDSNIGVGNQFEVTSIRIEYTASANVGTRVPLIEVLDSESDVVSAIELSTVITLGQSKIIQLSLGKPALVGTILSLEQLPSRLLLFPGQSLRVKDNAAIDAGADDMVVHVTGEVR